jgi:hypothetical protein
VIHSDTVLGNTYEKRRRAIALALVVICGVGGFAISANAEQGPAMQGLDEQVQEVKGDVLAIANELKQLEEKLLYPSNTQVAVFVALGEGSAQAVVLDSVKIQIDDEPVARHIYSFKELEALRRGGVQRLYTGNVSSGEHRIHVTMAGKLSSGSVFDETESFAFTKEVEPKVVGLTLTSGAVGGAKIRLGGW